jgi:hypothetical protein
VEAPSGGKSRIPDKTCYSSKIMRLSHRELLAPVVLLAAAAVGCVHQPQNPQEFRQCITDGHGAKDSYVVHRPFDDVYLSLHDKAVPGFNQRSIDTFLSGNQIDHSQNIFNCTLTGQGVRAELVIQKVVHAIGPTMPEGGWYWLIADLEAESPQDTRLTTYGMSGLFSGKTGDALEAIRQWAQGKDVPAPSLK